MVMDYLKRTPEGFVLLGHWDIKAGGIGYGTVAPWTIRTDLDDVPTMLLSASDGGMGCSGETDTLIALTPTGPEDRGSFALSTGYQDDPDVRNGPKDFHYDGKIVPLERGKAFVVDFSGTKSARIIYTKQAGAQFLNEDSSTANFPPSC